MVDMDNAASVIDTSAIARMNASWESELVCSIVTFSPIFLDFARSDFGHHDDGADRVGRALLTSGAFEHIDSI
jgi:hypothetical protein